MPGWNIHLEAGERVAQRLKLSPKEKEEFLLGCILPDINNGYINKVKVTKEHEETHFSQRRRGALDFLVKYGRKIKDREPVYLGYLFHLYTDGFFNENFYEAILGTEMGKLNHEQKLEIKHNDFWIYDAKFRERNLEIEDLGNVVRKANEIEEVEISEEDVLEVERILKSDDFVTAVKNKKYIFYTEQKLDEILDGVVEGFFNRILY